MKKLIFDIPFVEVTMKEPMEVSQQLLTWEELLLMANLNRTATIETAPESDTDFIRCDIHSL